MMLITIVVSLLGLHSSLSSIDLPNNGTISFKQFSLNYDQNGYPTLESLKKTILQEYFSPINTDGICVEKISEQMYVIRSSKEEKEDPLFYLKIVSHHESIFKCKELKKDSDYDPYYPLFTPDNLPIVIWVENKITYKNNSEKNIFITLTVNESAIK